MSFRVRRRQRAEEKREPKPVAVATRKLDSLSRRNKRRTEMASEQRRTRARVQNAARVDRVRLANAQRRRKRLPLLDEDTADPFRDDNGVWRLRKESADG